METYLNFLLIRFGLIAGGLVLLALAAFAVAVVLKRRGRLEDVRRYAEPAARAAMRAAARRLEGGSAARRGGGGRGEGR
ncbi:hypothetical protein GCM10010218_40740 [Streptomyces mashuensis]|uniref:Uncharacterized protein n=1 Tax=Streptomyces mashuensis TaxID=33904 RepID=A0A919B5G8_9ACTN|nr:hypothetical protein [Streptomyces mashuensis]GHF55182.1 hypothetical protein GCM10010218_40740 [Streptomyces mashuensis]